MNELLVGKVKTVFPTAEPDVVLIQYEDRVTAGNGRREMVLEDKGRICCEISSIIFDALKFVASHSSIVLTSIFLFQTSGFK